MSHAVPFVLSNGQMDAYAGAYDASKAEIDAFANAIAAGKADIESAKFDSAKRAGLAKTLEGFIRSCVEIPTVPRRACETVLQLIAVGAVDDFDELEQDLRNTFASGRQILEGVRELAARFQRIGGSLINSHDIDTALTELADMETEFFANWRHFDPIAAEEARKAFERGECLELDDAFAQIRGVSREAWLQLVAEHKNKHNP